ncbi:hypothetical protein C8D88_10468 [Lentzea atacamensis]|uniref:AMP-binding enzyme C-terminal domain-containing protein n=1 Tax=Lentzea atacamensis TaxID=531938 RepID=A0A316I3D4_9PSEU|nr:hypothetical protein C8D88_10468 [Lentzea atacamensis]
MPSGDEPEHVVLAGGQSLRAFATGKLAHCKIPRYVMVVDEFPMTVTGKVRKVEMREKSVQMLDLGEAAAIRNA